MNTCKSYSETHRAGPGASTVLLILLVMCLAMLGALSLSVARNDLAVTNRAVQAEEAYYLAQSQAAALLAETDKALLNARKEAANNPEIWLSALESIEGYTPATDTIIHEIPVDEYRTLHVALRPEQTGDDARWTVIENSIYINE